MLVDAVISPPFHIDELSLVARLRHFSSKEDDLMAVMRLGRDGRAVFGKL